MASRFSNVLMNLQRLQMHRTKFVPLAQTVLAGFRILLSLRLLRREYQFPFNFLKSIFDTATDRNASHSHTKMIYASENGRRRRQENILKRGKENKIIRHTSELLGVNLDKMKHALKTDGKDLFAQKGTPRYLTLTFHSYFCWFLIAFISSEFVLFDHLSAN